MIKITISSLENNQINARMIKYNTYFTFGDRRSLFIRIDDKIYSFDNEFGIYEYQNVNLVDSTQRYLNFTYVRINEINGKPVV